jgi:hypothetical protein
LKLIEVVGCAAVDDGIRLDMRAEDQEVHSFEVSSTCAGVLAATLAAEFEKLNVQDKQQQFIRPTGMQTAMTDRGEPMILMALKSGAELPLVFRSESLGVLISELQGLMRQLRPGSEVRWQ